MSRRKDLERELKKLRRKVRRAGATVTYTPRPKRDQKAKRPPAVSISDRVLEQAKERQERVSNLTQRMFASTTPMPGVVPNKSAEIAQDQRLTECSRAAAFALDQQIIFAGGWAGNFGGGLGGGGYGAFAEGQLFLGYPYLSELAQRPEYRMITETTATEMTRKWIKIEAATSKPKAGPGPFSGLPGTGPAPPPPDKSAKVKQLEDEMSRLQVQERFREIAEQDGFFGRAHLYMDFDDANTIPDELKTPVGDGLNSITRAKVKQGSLKRIQTVEAAWSYPTGYNSSDPLAPDWYRPQMWFAMGKEVHSSRFLTFIGREVPDMLKPAYSFGGLSMSQMAKPYVDNWLRTRQSVSDLLHSFTVWQLGTNLNETLTPGGEQLFRRVQLFNLVRDNKGMMLTDKETEELNNISTPLSTLDALQGQAQEQMCSVAHTPKVKLLGLDPAGLNASAEGEMRAYYDYIHAMQPKFFGPNLDRVFRFAQINLWGEVDPDLSYKWVDLWSLDEKAQAEVRKINADTGAILVETGAIDNTEERTRIASEEGSPYHGLDVNKIIEPPADESGMGGGLGLSQGGGLGGSEKKQFGGEG